MQTEIAEAFETPAQPGTPPLGRAPALSVNAQAAAALTPALLATIVSSPGTRLDPEPAAHGRHPALLLATSGALAAVADISQTLEADADRMRGNVEVTQGLLMVDAVAMVLAPKIGIRDAQTIVAEAADKALSSKRHLNSILAEDPRVTVHMTQGELARLFELMGYQGVAQTFIDRQIASVSARPTKR